MGAPYGLNETAILWARYTWNPFSGCEAVSDECKFCYANTIATRYAGTSAFPAGFEFTYRANRLDGPRNLRQPATIFANSMSDLFWSKVPGDVREAVIGVVQDTPQHVYLALTKRAEAQQRYSELVQLPRNLWAGVSVGRRAHLKRLDALRRTRAAVRFVSFEPLLEDLGRVNLGGIDLAIVGGESGSHLYNPHWLHARALVQRTGPRIWTPDPRKMDRVRRLRDQCLAVGVAFFFKQWGGPFDHIAGRELDGRTWEEYPVDLPFEMLNQALPRPAAVVEDGLTYERVDL